MLDWNLEKSSQLGLVLNNIEGGSDTFERKDNDIQVENVSDYKDSDADVDTPCESKEDDIKGIKRR